MPENAHNKQKPIAVPEPDCASVPGKDWGPAEFAELEELLKSELIPRWLGQVKTRRDMASQAEDIVQDFQVKLHRNIIPGYEPAKPTRFVAYLGTCFRHHLIDAWQAHEARLQREQPLEEEHPPGQVVHINAERQAELLALREAIDELPERERRVIRLSFDGCSYREIGQRLGIKEGYARVLAHKARNELKEKLEKGKAHG